MSAVNISEVLAILTEIEIDQEEAGNIVNELVKDIVSFDQSHALTAALLRKQTKKLGLSLGDRSCLALAKLHRLPVLTADKTWSKLDIGVKILLIR